MHAGEYHIDYEYDLEQKEQYAAEHLPPCDGAEAHHEEGKLRFPIAVSEGLNDILEFVCNGLARVCEPSADLFEEIADRGVLDLFDLHAAVSDHPVEMQRTNKLGNAGNKQHRSGYQSDYAPDHVLRLGRADLIDPRIDKLCGENAEYRGKYEPQHYARDRRYNAFFTHKILDLLQADVAIEKAVGAFLSAPTAIISEPIRAGIAFRRGDPETVGISWR